jgi:hypothetical protein
VEVKEVGVGGIALRDAAVGGFARVTVEVEGIILFEDFVTESEVEGGLVEGVTGVESEEVADFVDVVEGGDDIADTEACGLGSIAPGGGVFGALARVAGIAEGDFGDIGESQAGFDGEIGAIDVERIAVEVEPGIAGREESAAAVVPGTELGVACAEEVLFRVDEFEADGIVVVIEDAAAVEFEETVVGQVMFEVEAFDAAEGIARETGALLVGCFVTVDEGAADAEFDPVTEIGFWICAGFGVVFLSLKGDGGWDEQGGEESDTVMGEEVWWERWRVHGGRAGLEAEGRVDMGAVDGFVAAGIPAGAALEEGGMVEAADEDLTAGGLLLEMAFEAESCVTLGEEFLVDGSVGEMAGGAAFAHGFVFEDVGATLGGVALEAGIVFGEEGGVTADDGVAFVRVMAIGAGEPTFGDGVVVREIERAADVEVAGEAGVGGFQWIKDKRDIAAGLAVEAAGAVTRFAADIDGVIAFGLKSSVGGGGEVTDERIVAFGAGVGADVGGAGDGWGRHDSMSEGAARDEDDGGEGAEGEGEVTFGGVAGRGWRVGARPWGLDRVHKVARGVDVGVVGLNQFWRLNSRKKA